MISEAMGVEGALLRTNLRTMGVDKNGGSYQWKTKKEMDAVQKQLTDHRAKAEKAEKAEKPAKKKATKKKAD